MFAYPIHLHNHPEVGVNAHLCRPGGNPHILDVQIYASTHTLFRALTHTHTCTSPSANNAGLYVNPTPIRVHNPHKYLREI